MGIGARFGQTGSLFDAFNTKPGEARIRVAPLVYVQPTVRA
jgi:hypothetical protein